MKFLPKPKEMIIIGGVLIIISIGALYSRHLLFLSLYLLLLGVILNVMAANTIITKFVNKESASWSSYGVLIGSASALLLLLGIQSPQLPAKYILPIGIVFVIPQIFIFVKSKL